MKSNWLHFEAGAISRKEGNVLTFLLDLKPTDITQPFSSFQHTLFEEKDIFKLIKHISEKAKRNGEITLPDKELVELFDALFPQFKKDLDKVVKKIRDEGSSTSSEHIRSEQEMLEEVLNSIREIQSNRFNEISEETVNRLENLHTSHEYFLQQQVLLRKTRLYGNLVLRLLAESVAEQHKVVARVTENRYLYWLEEAIKSCDSYFTLQRNPPCWFEERGGAGKLFLRALRDKKMAMKTRIFVIDSENEMLKDLSFKETMRNYWDNTGEDVHSFWITIKKLKEFLGAKNLQINDMVLCNQELLFQYEFENKVLRFDVLDNEPKEESMKALLLIIEAVDRQLKSNLNEPFNRIEPWMDKNSKICR